MSERYALYFAPDVASPLWQRASQWLGRDCAGGAVTERPAEIEGIALDPITKSARHYGFHATLKAPMMLAGNVDRAELETALTGFARAAQPVDIGRLVVAQISHFLALIPEKQSTALTDFAAECVTAFDRFRAPMTAAQREQRLSGGLSPRQIALVDQYGYPYVLEEFRFHMTLTDRLKAEDSAPVKAAAEAWFGDAIAAPVPLDRIVLFHQPVAGADFVRLGDYVLGRKD
ncbi:MAG TPA: DUF1045 domain-containing protein [Devosiaceae bacterium]|jgi:putative phosphonate metabolism protein